MNYINTTIPLSQIHPGTYQNRAHYDRDQLDSLAQSIQKQGLINPLIVHKTGDVYSLVAGERRWRALCLANLVSHGHMSWRRALDLVSANDARQRLCSLTDRLRDAQVDVRVIPNENCAQILSVVDNSQRQNLNPVEEAQDYQALLDNGYDLSEIASLVGKSEVTIRKTVALLTLEPVVQTMLISGQLEKTSGQALTTIKEPKAQIGLAQRAGKLKMKVVAVEAACKAYHQQAQKPQPQTTIPLNQVKAISVYTPPRHPYLTPAGADYILALAEESCHKCRETGFSDRCLTCDGFTEFATRLLQEVTYEIR
ncbi:MAG: ParB/RepB/Spo0J family partition protein [Chloroflexota bacterium]